MVDILRTEVDNFQQLWSKMFQISQNQLELVKDAFALRGESVADWARQHNFNAALVYSVLNGRIKCRRGEAHRIAVELGLKASTPAQPSSPANMIVSVNGSPGKANVVIDRVLEEEKM